MGWKEQIDVMLKDRQQRETLAAPIAAADGLRVTEATFLSNFTHPPDCICVNCKLKAVLTAYDTARAEWEGLK